MLGKRIEFLSDTSSGTPACMSAFRSCTGIRFANMQQEKTPPCFSYARDRHAYICMHLRRASRSPFDTTRMPQNVNTDFGHCLIPEIAQNFSISGLTGKDGKKSKNFATVTICAARGDFFFIFFHCAFRLYCPWNRAEK